MKQGTSRSRASPPRPLRGLSRILEGLSPACLLALSLAGCTSDVPPPNLIPPAPEETTTVEQLSGDYCYFGPDLSVRFFRRGTDSIPFLDIQKLWWPATIRVDATAERIVFTCTDSSGYEEQQVFLPSRFQAEWREDALVVPWKEVRPNVGEMIGINVVGNVLGFVLAGILHSDSYSPNLYLGGRSRESRLFRLADGRLVMADTLRASGDLKERDMASGAWERQDSVALLLEPATGDCAAAAASRPLQPRFEKGLDLRLPACADRLEKEFASILVEKGETEEVARTLAGETVNSLVNEGGDWAQFLIDSPSGSSYKFNVGKSKGGCVLRLYGRTKRTGHSGFSTESNIFFLAKRPLPECTCVT
jgi:hypothetical protein